MKSNTLRNIALSVNVRTKPSSALWMSRPLGIVLIALASFAASAQVQVYTNYQERIGNVGRITALDVTSAFGEQIDPGTGSGAFYVPVLRIPGNNGLDIVVNYKLGVRDYGGAPKWYVEQDQPYIGGTFSLALGWTSPSGGTARCSNIGTWNYGPPTAPADALYGSFEASEYWDGYQLSLPGGGGAFLNHFSSGTPAPTTGGPFHWATKDLWFFSCTPLIDGAGEGFVGHSPDGLKYYFNSLRATELPSIWKLNSGQKEVELPRQEIRIYAQKIADRFGNYVDGLTASDGRSVTKTVSNGVVTYTYGDRQWVVKTGNPFTVIYPDGSEWRATISGAAYNTYFNSDCLRSGIPQPGPLSATATVTVNAPSGAVGTYVFRQQAIGYSYTSRHCFDLADGGVTLMTPAALQMTGLVQRTISGPGLTPSTLTIDYGPQNACYAGRTCTTTSPTTRTITHSYTDGTYKRYTYGNRYQENADLLLKLEEGATGSTPLRTTEYEYAFLPTPGSYVGAPSSTSDYARARRNRVLPVAKVVHEAGRAFSWRIPMSCGTSGTGLCIDQYGRPTRTVRSSQPSN